MRHRKYIQQRQNRVFYKIIIFSFIITVLMVSTIVTSTLADVQVNTYMESYQGEPSVAMDANGNFIIVWSSSFQDGGDYGIYAQMYDNAGNPVGSEFRVNTYTESGQGEPSVAMDASGNFVIAWSSSLQDGSSHGIYAQRYDSDGNPVGSEFQVNTYTTDYQSAPSVAMDAGSNFVIAWHSWGQDGSGNGIYAQRYDSDGNPVGSEFQVNTYTADNQHYASVAMDAVGNFVIAWQSWGQDGSDWGIYGQRYDNAGNPVGSEFQVNTYTTSEQYFPSLARNASGNFVIAWSSNGQDGNDYGIYAQMYDNAGNPVGSEFQVNTYTTSEQSFASAAMDTGGNFVISWQSYLQDGGDYGIYAQRYNSAGTLVGSEFQVSSYTIYDQRYPSVAMNTNGNFAISWTSDGQDGSSWGIFMKLYYPDISVSPTTYNFGNIVVGNSSAPQTFTISNTGTADLHISGMILSDDSNYSLNVNGGSSPCGITTPTIAPDSSCTVSVTFSPSSTGTKNAILTINSDAPDTPTLDVPLSGTGEPLIECNLVPDWPVVVQGGTLEFQGTITNNTDKSGSVLFATAITLPSGNRYPPYGYLIGPLQVYLNSYQSKSGHRSQHIPHYAPLGTYTYHGYAGRYDMGILAECQFNFTVNSQGQGCNLCHQ